MKKLKDKKIVLVTGVFDVLHQEHIVFLQKAKKHGEHLIVGIESDVRVRKMKGEGRPIHPQNKRVENLIKLQIANDVFILPEQFDRPQDHEALISSIKPDILAVSSHTMHLDKKTQIVEKYGGKVMIVHQQNPLYSSTISILKESQKK